MALNTLNRLSCTRDCGENPKNAYVVHGIAGKTRRMLTSSRFLGARLWLVGARRNEMTSPACASSGPQEQDGRGPWWDTTILTAPAAIWLLRWPARIRNAWSASSGSADACAYERRNLHDPNLEMIAPSVVQVACRVRSGIELQFVGQPCPLSPFWESSSWHPDHST